MATDRVCLEDLSGRIQVFNLPHEVYCDDDRCGCAMTQRHENVVTAEGRGGIKVIAVRLCDSVTLLPNAKTGPLHKSVIDCPDVKSAMLARPTRVRVIPA